MTKSEAQSSGRRARGSGQKLFAPCSVLCARVIFFSPACLMPHAPCRTPHAPYPVIGNQYPVITCNMEPATWNYFFTYSNKFTPIEISWLLNAPNTTFVARLKLYAIFSPLSTLAPIPNPSTPGSL